MDNNVLIISQGSTFMVDAIAKNLKEAGFNAIITTPDIKDFSSHEDDAEVYLFYLGDYIENIAEALIYLKDVCIEKDKILNVIGDKVEVDILKKKIPEGIIVNVFSRPLDIKKMISVMSAVLSSSDEYHHRRNILLVDDDVTYLKTVKGWLDEDYRVTIVNSGMQAITYVAKNTPDLILLDYEMPITPGPQVMEMMKSEMGTSSIPIIFLTGKGDKESVQRVLSLKPQGYILKTVGKEKLLEQIANFFESQKASRY